MSEPSSRRGEVLAGRYRVERELGAGGMATVYLAHDLRHDRSVAIKVLRPELAAVIGADRFLAEIRTTAHLQHAHILGLIDSGEANGTVFYVMPFIDGESLRQRLKRETQIPIADACRIATDIAGALDYAHRRGVIHRDIKPENILLHEGQPFVADFGIALAVTRSGDGTRITESGMSLGTPQYMSPEQAMGERTLDARTDVYALGCVLYEMLTGEPPFSGPTAQAVIAKVMTVEPEPVTTLRRSVPSNVAAATMTAIQKVPADRFASAADFAAALNNPQYDGPSVTGQRRSATRAQKAGAREIGIAVALVIVAIIALIGWLRPSVAPATAISARFEIPVPDSVFGPVALSRDGRRLIWSNQSGVFERHLDSLAIRRLRESPQAGAMRDVGPNGTEALVSGRGGIAIAPLAGGPVRPLVPSGGRGGSWGSDGYVYFSLSDQQFASRGIARIRAEGGGVDTLLKTDLTVLEISTLPGGRGLIVALNRGGVSELDAFDLKSKTLHKLDATGSFAQYIAPGYLVWARGATIMAAPFDVDKLALTSAPVPFLEVPTGGVNLLTTGGDALAYLPVPEQTGSGVVIRSRSGASRPLPNIPDTLRFTAFALSPDAKRFAAAAGTPQAPGTVGFSITNIYIYELSSGRMSRLRSDERDQGPSWLPNGRELSFVRVSTDTPQVSTLMRRAWDGSSAPVAILQRPGGGPGGGRGALGPVAWLPDGRHAILRVGAGRGAGTGGRGGAPSGDLLRLSLDTPAKLDTVVATEYAESNPAVSPDGSLLAFTSDESGRGEVYIRPMNGGALRRVSLNGGTQPKWAHSGNELFYTNADTLFSAAIRRGADLDAGDVRVVFLARNINQGYAVLPGDTSFITPALPTTSPVVVVTNVAGSLAQLFAKK